MENKQKEETKVKLTEKLTEDNLALLREILETAARKSGESISKMLGTTVETEILNIYKNPIDLVEKEIEKENLGIILYSELKEGEGGITLFVMDEESAMKLSGQLLGKGDEKSKELGEAERSALREVGNILLGNFLAEIGDYFDIPILHTPPELKHDMIGVYLESLLGYSDELENNAIISEVKIVAKGVGVNGRYILFPSDTLTEDFMDNLF
ncbi:MAG: chemotaxis protein CheC [Candidatus Thermoplasmatota archaeon]|nr:chemotaxis protein CheC [Candidatus Thermoplasmatota archaeon]